ncbi:hypothetical protein GTY65_31005 [Streptomyces sp. SID8379]|uniref:hypothetical protein n=1 Tax=unclassified Streptomyces TaxID=2593676 RepID=UPI00036A1664|nr:MULTISPECIES: hypothetical protein [unclassified Streptomyces]MYW68472.1 hypothetical protein [Streptomyces sp. SID8379]
MRRSVITGAAVAVALLAAGALTHPVTAPAGASRVAARESGGDWLLRMAERAAQPPRPAEQARGERLLTEAISLLRATPSVRIAEDITVTKGQRIRVDLRMNRHGDCAGTLDAGVGKRGDIIFIAARKGHEAEGYLKYTDTALNEMRALALRADPDTTERVLPRLTQARGKYVKLPQGPRGTDPFAKQCRIGQTLGSMASDVAGTRARPAVRRAGHRLIPLVPPADSANSKDTGTVYVDADGKPYLRSMEGTSGGKPLSLTFSAYGEPVPAHRPDPALTVEFPPDEDSVFAV